jgi:chromosome segregation ATPase
MTSLNPQTTPRHQLRAEKARRNKEAALAAFLGKKAEIDAKLRSVRSQKADLEMQIQREETRLEQLRQAVDKHRERIEASKKTEKDLEPATAAAIAQVRATVAHSLPFKRSERLAEIDKLRDVAYKHGLRLAFVQPSFTFDESQARAALTPEEPKP